jgi:peroxiredoxin
LNAQVNGVSVNAPIRIKPSQKRASYLSPLLSDYNSEVIKTYGAESFDFAGLKGYTVAKRSIIILDEKSILQSIWISEDPSVEPNYDEIQKSLEQIP